MKNLTLQLRLASLLSLILLACMSAYGQLTPSGDSYTNTATPTTNFGSKTVLDLESSETTFIQFDLSSIPTGYTGANITKATLKLYVDAITTAGSFNVDYVNGTWTESTIDASNAPALGTTIAASIPLTTKDKNQYILVDITAAVQAWLNGTPNDGIALVANSPLSASFDSKEATKTSHTAELVIVFAGGSGSGITGINTAAGSGLIGGGTSGTLNLSLTNACAASQILQWNGSAWACASPGTGTITGVTAGTDLLGGGTSGNVTLSLNTAATNALYAQLNAANTFTGNQSLIGTLSSSASSSSATAVQGIATSATGSTTGVLGVTESTSGAGVNGLSTALSGVTTGVSGGANSPTGYGVLGANSATTGNAVGVLGTTQSTTGYGVEGTSPLAGVYGTSPNYGILGSGFYGVLGNGTEVGTGGDSESPTGYGVLGQNTATTGNAVAVLGLATAPAGIGVFGAAAADGTVAISPAGAPYGVVGGSPTVGVYGASSGASALGGTVFVHSNGVWGDYAGSDGIGVLGTADNAFAGAFLNNSSTIPTIYADNETTSAGGGVFVGQMPYLGTNGQAIIGDPGCGAGSGRMAIQLSLGGMSNCTNYTLTGGSNGETYLNAVAGETVHLRVNNVDALRATSTGVAVVGTLSKGGGSFMIDHPLDPANKYLYHSFVESPDMKNIYDGTITTDGAGLATVTLPDWFGALNRDFRYQLTVIGQFAQAIVASEISGNQFGIRTDKPNVKVSWQVTGIRQDSFANANRIPVEVEKAPADRGRYLYPEAIGAPTTARIGYEALPPGEQIVHHQRPILHSGSASPARTITLPAPPKPFLPKVAPLPHPAPLSHPAAQVSKPEFNQK